MYLSNGVQGAGVRGGAFLRPRTLPRSLDGAQDNALAVKVAVGAPEPAEPGFVLGHGQWSTPAGVRVEEASGLAIFQLTLLLRP